MYKAYLSPNREPEKDIVDEDGEHLTHEELRQKNSMKRLRQKQQFENEDSRRVDIKERLAVRRMVCDEDDSDNDDDPVIAMPSSLRISREEVRAVKNKPNPSHRLLRMSENNKKRTFADMERVETPKSDKYSSFPGVVVKQEIEDGEYEDVKEIKPDPSDDERKKKRKKKHKRYRSRSRSPKGRTSKKKKHRRRRYSSSSSSSSSSSESRSTSRSSSNNYLSARTFIPVKKWSFISNDELSQMHMISCNSWVIMSREPDSENVQLGMPKREIPTYRLKFKFIDGLGKEENENKFFKYFSNEFAQTKQKTVKEKPFYVQLMSTAKHVPQESKFRKKVWRTDNESGYVPISKEAQDIFEYQSEKRRLREELENEFRQKANIEYDDSIINSISDLQMREQAINMRLSREQNNSNLWIEFIDLQDKIYEARRIHEVCDVRSSYMERKDEIIKTAISKNPKNVQLYIMRVDLMIEMRKDPETIISVFKDITHNFPHIPMAWNRYLDYVQYDTNAYSYARMETVFDNCLEKMRGLVDGTLRSHITFITDVMYIRKYQLYVYVRYLKWLMDNGCVPLAIANIQATFELNFGFPFDKVGLKTHRQRVDMVSEFWNTKMPRIGDRGARGALLEYERHAEILRKTKEAAGNGTITEIQSLEYEQYDIDLYNTRNEIQGNLMRCDRPISENWVNFERNMLNIEARVKRNPSKYYDEEYRDDFEVFELWEPIKSSDLRLYYHPPDETIFDFVQPLLELLGTKFSNTSNVWCTTEELLEAWKAASPENSCNFEKVPTYTEKFCRTLATNIIDYLVTIEYAVSDQKKMPYEKVMNLLVASMLTKSADMERNRKTEIWELKTKDLTEMLREVLTPYGTIIDQNPIVGKVLQLSAIQKYLEWYRVAKINFAEIRQTIDRCKARKTKTALYIDQNDEKRITKRIPKHVNDLLQEIAPLWIAGESKIGKSAPLSGIQIHLFAILLRLNMTSAINRKALLIVLGSQILEIPMKDVDTTNHHKIRETLIGLIEELVQRENYESNTLIDVLPKSSIIAQCLLVALQFSTLDNGENDKEMVSSLATRLIEQVNRLDTTNEKNVRDGKLIIDQLLNGLTDVNERKILHLETYKYVIQAALFKFPADIRYSRRYVDDMTTCIAKKIDLQKNLDLAKQRFNQKRRERFEFEIEVNLKILAIVTMYSSLKMYLKSEEQSANKSLLRIFQREAEAMQDPALWRIAIKFASKIEGSNLRELNDTHIMASGQCGWARNIHIDRVDVQPVEETMSYVMMLMKEKSRKSPHSMFASDIRTIQSFADIAKQRLHSLSESSTQV